VPVAGSRQCVEQRFCLFEIGCVETLGEPAVDGREEIAGFGVAARDGQWDRKAKHHLVPGAGQSAAAEAVRDQANKRAQDLADAVEQLRASGVASLREIAAALNKAGAETPRGAPLGASSVRNLLARINPAQHP
jgi:hypothetical protein